jgi:S-DNA-T family DNA segregation ATPase FtsK/SpoIIIE
MVVKKKNLKLNKKEKESFSLVFSERVGQKILAVLIFLIALILGLSFFNKAGVAGKFFFQLLFFLFGKAVFFVPLILLISAILFFKTFYKKIFWQNFLATLILILALSGILGAIDLNKKESFGKFLLNYPGEGGRIGNFLSWPLLKLFGFWVTEIIFLALILISFLIFWHLYQPTFEEKEEQKKKESLITRILKRKPKFKIKEIEPEVKEYQPPTTFKMPELKIKKITEKSSIFEYQIPPLNLLEPEKESPNSGDTRENSAIIKKTLENFGIEVSMSEINIGPTVTQYTLKPAEGIKLSRITALANNLALALAAHPIRIEAPIPGRALVGIEVPNKIRAQVRLRNLIENPNFQNSLSNLTFVLGRDVSGQPVYADLARMPHLLVAGATGSGKTIFLNTLIISLLYQNSPEILKFILIDPKRVEFPIYNDLFHLLCPVIFDAQKTCNLLKWLISEMERRFNLLAETKSRDILSYNEKITEKEEIMPYIVLIIDELADLMAAKGKEIEAGIVRLAQMARAVGIHLVVATQRPSVEVITGLIKANITSRIAFQVASQFDSRTILDTGGAEKLLGLGDFLFVCPEIIKPKRIQAPYVSEKEIKRVVNFIKQKAERLKFEIGEEILETGLSEDLEKKLEISEEFEEDPLYEEAKRVVIEAQKASASLLQRRLRIGYARAARLIDFLEERGVVGPGEGAKPRKVYLPKEE